MPAMVEQGALEATSAAMVRAVRAVDRQVLRASFAARAGDPLSVVHTLKGATFSWRLSRDESRRRLFFGPRSEKTLLWADLELALRPTPEPQATDLLDARLEYPPILLPASTHALARFAPARRVGPENTLLLALSADPDEVLAVRHPERLLGVFHAKIWYRGERLRDRGGRWPRAPFLALVRRLRRWLDGELEGRWLPLALSRDDDLSDALAALVAMIEGVQTALGTRAEVGPSWARPLAAHWHLARAEGSLQLRLDTSGELSAASESKTVTVRVQLGLDLTPHGATFLEARFLPPARLAPRDEEDSVLDVLERAVSTGLDDDGVRAFLRLLAALHRFSRALPMAAEPDPS